MENKITNQKIDLSNDKLFLSVLLSLIFIQFLVLFFNHELYVDTAWLGEYTYWLNKKGFVKSELMRGLMDFDEKIVFNPHKYFLLQGSFMIDLFGFSHYTLESLVVIYLLIFGVIGWATRSYHLETKKNTLIFFCLFLAYPLVQRFSIAYRPEIVIMCMGFVSYHFLNRFLGSGRILFIVLASAFAGIAAMIHWNGLAFIGAGALLLLTKRKLIPLILFSIIATLVASLYVV